MDTVEVRATIGQCGNYIGSGGDAKEATAIISPIRIIQDTDGTLVIRWGCSRYFDCSDRECEFSKAARDMRRQLKAERF